VVILLWTAGCSSGRVGAFYLLDDAVAVEDAHVPYQRTAVYSHDRVSTLKGVLVPTTAAGRCLVVEEGVYAVRPVRTSAMRADQRFPKWVIDHVLRTYDLTTGEIRTLPNPLDSDDEHLMQLRLVGDGLFAAIGHRLNVQLETEPARYAAYRLPDGPWQPLTLTDGRLAFPRYWTPVRFVDLRTAGRRGASDAQQPATPTPVVQPPTAATPAAPSGDAPTPSAPPAATGPATPAVASASRWGRIASFADLGARGLTEGDWGRLIERQVRDRWEVVYRSPDGREFVLLRQNDGGNAGNAQAWGAVLGLEAPRP
jgi:hypothetical protein